MTPSQQAALEQVAREYIQCLPFTGTLGEYDNAVRKLVTLLAAQRAAWLEEVAIKWTDQKPTDVGMYWWRNAECIGVVEVTMASGELFASGKYVFDWVASITGEWAGPLQTPKEPRL